MVTRKGLLYAVLTQIVRLVPRSATVPALQHVKLDAYGHTLRLEATDLTTHLTASIPCEGRFSGCLPARSLAEFVRPDDTKDRQNLVEIIGEEDGKASVAVEAALTALATIPVSDFPRRPGEKLAAHEWRGAGTWRASDFADALGWIALAASTDETRKHLAGIRFEADRIVATDGHRLHLARMPGLGAVAALLPSTTITALLRLVPKSGDVAALRAKDAVRFRCTSGDVQWEVETRALTETFPPIDQVIPKDGAEDHFAVVERDALLRAVTRMPRAKDRRHVGLRMIINGAIKLERDGDDGVTSMTVPVIRTTHTGADSVLGMSADYLADALACAAPVVTARFGGELDPIRIDIGKDRLAVVMPMRL